MSIGRLEKETSLIHKDDIAPKLLIRVFLILILLNFLLLRYFPLHLPLSWLVRDYMILSGINVALAALTIFPKDCKELVTNIKALLCRIFARNVSSSLHQVRAKTDKQPMRIT